MKRPGRLPEGEIATRLESLPGWAYEGGRLLRLFTFQDFSEAFGFMARAALAAEKLDHHPDWSNAWNQVKVELVTHDAGGVTELDLALAFELSRLAAVR